jgi:putative salt-induced outer membrane protein
MTKRTLLGGLILLVIVPRLAVAQPAAPPPLPEREGTAEFAYVGTSGNSSTQTIGVGGEFIYRPSRWETRVKAAFVRNESDEEVKAQSFAGALRTQHLVSTALSVFGQYGYQRDRFAGILGRNAVEGGLAYAFVGHSQKLIIDASGGYANEERVTRNDLSTATAAAGALYTWNISSTSQFTEEARFVDSLSQTTDWRYLNAASLTAKMTSVLSLKVTNTIRYLNFPVAGFKKTDTITSVALVAKF